jgi:hypothetical protein
MIENLLRVQVRLRRVDGDLIKSSYQEACAD